MGSKEEIILDYIAKDMTEKFEGKAVALTQFPTTVAFSPEFYYIEEPGIMRARSATGTINVSTLEVKGAVNIENLADVIAITYEEFLMYQEVVKERWETRRTTLEGVLGSLGFKEDEEEEIAGVEQAFKEFEEDLPLVEAGVYHTKTLKDFKELIALVGQQGYSVSKDMAEGSEVFWNIYTEDTAVIVSAFDGVGIGHIDQFADKEGTKLFRYVGKRGES